MSARPWRARRLHFVGVGGAGMSGYARAAHALGATVSGSDRAPSPYLRRLREEGILDAHLGHHAANLPTGADVEVIHSSAIPPDNPERLAARERGLPDRPRAELLAELTALRRTIAVAGAHGKTTTCAMIVHALRGCGTDPSWLVGSSVGTGLDNSHWSEAEWLVVEADESDRSMLSLHVEIAVLTNVELDHHANFRSLAELRDAFREFLAHARRAIVIWDRPELLDLVPPAPDGHAEPVQVGPGQAGSGHSGSGHSEPGQAGPGQAEPGQAGPGQAEPGRSGPRRSKAGNPGPRRGLEIVPYDAPAPLTLDGGSRFSWRGHEVRLTVPGAHNALDATAALEATRLAGCPPREALAALARFGGAGRRFQLIGATPGGAQVYDDYAHHPTEVAATLSAARTLPHKRLIAVFQPHLYSRTALLAEEFGEALARADAVVLLDVYPARELADDHPGVSGLLLMRSTSARAEGRPVLWAPTFADAERELRDLLEEGDLCVVMGAGDVDSLARRLVGA
jgi:UDP-N-acetylmuramate--alanine ligase